MQRLMNWTCAMGLLASTAMAGVFYADGERTLHFAFEGSPNPDRPIIRPPAYYRADDGFGFVDSPTVRGTSRAATAPKYFRFDVNVPPGNYDVTIQFGGTAEESITTVKAEGHRPMVLDARSTRQQPTTRPFTVNVRHGNANDTSLDLDARLNLEFVGTNPSMMKLDIKPNDKAVTLFLLGDVAVADQEKPPLAGWGQLLPLLFNPGEVAVANYAGPKMTADTFDPKQLDAIGKSMKAGDYIFIQLDGSDAATWKKTVQACIDEAKKHQATAVLVTPVMRSGKVPAWMNELAAAQKTPFIDLNAKALMFFAKLGSNGAAMAGDAGLTPYGAFEVAKLLTKGMQEQKLDLASHLVGDISSNPDPAKFPASLGYGYSPRRD